MEEAGRPTTRPARRVWELHLCTKPTTRVVASRSVSSKIFIKRGAETSAFMWADVGSDGSVMMGLLGKVAEEVEFASDALHGQVRQPTLLTQQQVGSSKISFHPTGLYKLSARMGLSSDAMDRATIQGTPLADISAPQRMLEIILPTTLPRSPYTPTQGDVVVEARDVDGGQPLRCTVCCMAPAEFEKVSDAVRDTGTLFVDTSAWEQTAVLANNSHVWTWTLRVSRDDIAVERREKVHIALLGPVRWGRRSGG